VTDKPEIKLKSEIHHKSTVVSLLFGYDRELINRVKTIEGAAWSNSRRFWYIPAEQFRLSEVFNALSPVAWLDYPALNEKNPENRPQITKQKSTCKIHFVNILFPFSKKNKRNSKFAQTYLQG